MEEGELELEWSEEAGRRKEMRKRRRVGEETKQERR